MRISDSFQYRVGQWADVCFTASVALDKAERNHRFLEESLELVQSLDCSREDAHALVDYVYDRLVGEPRQEVGGVMITLAALCRANGLDMETAGETELDRIWSKISVIRRTNKTKPRFGMG